MTESTPPWKILANPEPVACARTLAAAFSREPAVSWICRDSHPVRTAWFDATVRAHATLPGSLRYGLATPDGQLVASAILTPPGAAPRAVARAAWAARTALRCGPRALVRTLRYMRHVETAAPVGAWTLEFIGVRPDTAGRGAGRYLLDHVLAATPAQAGFFLTTADPANVPLYRRFGFADLRRTTLGPLDVRAMVKPGTGTRPGPARPQAPARTPLRRR